MTASKRRQNRAIGESHRVKCPYAIPVRKPKRGQKAHAAPRRDLRRSQLSEGTRRKAKDRKPETGRRRNRARMDRILRQKHGPPHPRGWSQPLYLQTRNHVYLGRRKEEVNFLLEVRRGKPVASPAGSGTTNRS